MIIPITILSCVIFGSLVRVLWGWLDSGMPFLWRKLASTMIATIFLALPIGATMMGTSITPDIKNLIGLGIAALMAGWGVDDALKQLSGMQVAKPKNGAIPPEGGPQ